MANSNDNEPRGETQQTDEEIEEAAFDGSDEGSMSAGLSEVTRRGTLATLGLGGLLALGSSAGSAERDSAATTVNFPGLYSGSPSGSYGLQIETENDANALVGYNKSASGTSTGVIGRSDSERGRGILGLAASSSGLTYGIRGRSDSTDGRGLSGLANAQSGENYGVAGESKSPDGYGLYSHDDAKVEGDLLVNGTKNFVQAVETSAGTREIAYNAVEAGRARTEHSDTAKLTDGVAVVELPDHFAMVTSSEKDLVVQVTPHARAGVQPQVTDRSLKRIVVHDFGNGPDEYEISYTVKGVREGFEDHEIVREEHPQGPPKSL